MSDRRVDPRAGADELQDDSAVQEAQSDDRADDDTCITDGLEREAAPAALRAAAERHSVLLYDREALRRAIRALEGRDADGGSDGCDGFLSPDDDAPRDFHHDLSAEERHRLVH